MNVFIATTQTQDLLKGEDQIWTYCLRREPLQKFIKEQYGKLVTLKPKIFVIDLRAFDSPSDLPLLIHSFPSAKYLIIVPAGQKFRMQHCIPFPEGKGLLKYLKEGPQQKKIGIISEEETYATALVAFQLISCLAREQGNLCYIEVGKNARLPERAEKFHLTKTEYGYEYNSIPFYSNLAKDTEISVFDFGKRDAAKENMLRRCDIPLIVGTEKGRKIRIKRGDQEAVIKIPKDPFRPELMDAFQNFIPEIDFGVTEKKTRKIFKKKDKKNPGSREKKTRKREKIPTSEKKESKNKRSKKLNVHKPDIQKFRRKITKKQFLILVFSLAVLSVGAATIRIQSAQKKETKVKEAVQEKQKEQHPEPTQASSEKQTEKSTEKRKSTKKKEKTTTASATSESGSYPVTTTSRSSSGRTSKQSTTRRSVVTTRKKRKVTTTRKPRPTTTRKPKPTTTERFDVNYGPE